ncbi:mitochondrial ribosome-associated GTPase 2 [Colletes gigas]|uniref:mitochondrial ribosome-associated GTPase 2 n=1 Tax=Colletes gigas TaxID=935657 RepID=UPI001C9A6CD4|nr:mitochondrial ribosome-associated GTPase 2 [Colletes gigas]XP_043251488.1 mitochondrial ribosome-associated GTPase 2 [Colletes gigas]XP_043251489.1 mitochondrial ribosome-associated GTPase 2 [Colletes gigas]XP_043251490.1 mitochondrial ribosome-associated GTPase 2 [Colletes gigas]
MHCFRQIRSTMLLITTWKQDIINITINVHKYKSTNKNVFNSLYTSKWFQHRENVPKPLRDTKPKSQKDTDRNFLDMKQVRTIGGNGGDGAISFLQLWSNDCAGPDGGDGGHGGHVIFEVSSNVHDLSHVNSVLNAENGEKGINKDCFGKNAKHTIVKVPLGTIVRNLDGKIVGDLNKEGTMFIAARGGAGGHGNAYFKSDLQQSPYISEYGAHGESLQYVLEIRSMAHIGLIGLPNSGKSTLLRAISRARPKVAPYAFTTLRPNLGMVLYDDYEQIAVADLPGLISDSHKNRGLGIQFLKHIERCKILLFILDITSDKPWADFETLMYEITQFNTMLNKRSLLIAANKIDLPEAAENLEILKQKIDFPIIPISAKMGINISNLLKEVRILYDKEREESEQKNVL